MKTKSITAGLLMFVVSCAPAWGTIVGYDLTGQPGGQTTSAATTVETGLMATDIVRGPGINAANLANGMSSNQWSNPQDEGFDGDRDDAIANGDYYHFDISVLPGFQASFSTLDVSLRRSGLGAPTEYEWQYSVDDFATDGVTIEAFSYLGRASAVGTTGATNVAENFNYMTEDVAEQGNGNPMPTIDLAGFGDLQGLSGGQSVAFRLYAWGADRNSRTVALGRFDGPVLGGTVVPEPGSLVLCFGGLLAVVGGMRRTA